jgi:hypothetical protein
MRDLKSVVLICVQTLYRVESRQERDNARLLFLYLVIYSMLQAPWPGEIDTRLDKNVKQAMLPVTIRVMKIYRLEYVGAP